MTAPVDGGAGGLALGLDFGTESVRALLVDGQGRVAGTSVVPYAHGQLVPGSDGARDAFASPLPPGTALADPQDWLEAAAAAVRAALADATGAGDAGSVAVTSIGLDATSCTVVPALADGRALVSSGRVDRGRPHAWPKLWKHHGAGEQAARLTAIARDRDERWLDRYGGVIGLEWFFPKILEVIDEAPDLADAVEVWVEQGDWLVWQLVGDTAGGPVRSTCQAGYKGLWSATDGFPSRAYLAAADPRLADVLDAKLPGRFAAPGERAGHLTAAAAAAFGLPAGIPVSAAVIDAHAGVPGAGVAGAGELVLVLGTSGCHLVMADDEHRIPGVAGVVADGILPGYFGYETGQAAVGDAFEWVRTLVGAPDHATLERAARAVPPGAEGVVAVDWFNGCRTPLMDGAVGGAVLGLGLHHGPAHLYRAALEGSAAGLRWIVETLRAGGVRIDRLVATGGLARDNRLFVEIVASMLGLEVHLHAAAHGPALGAAILGAVAAGRFATPAAAVGAMAGARSALPPPEVVAPTAARLAADERGDDRVYDRVYDSYRRAADAVVALTPTLRRVAAGESNGSSVTGAETERAVLAVSTIGGTP